jgi:mono/diheme cytochrome c family protein
MTKRPTVRPAKIRKAAPRLPRIITTITLLVVAMVMGAVVFILWGVYNVSALQQHTEPVYLALNTAMQRSISRRARSIDPPPLLDQAMIERGLHFYRQKCVQCHGAPGIGRDVGKGLTPVPASMVESARTRTPAEIFWTIKHGVKMTGMPAWQFTFSDEEIWSIVAFVMQLPRLTPSEYKAMAAAAVLEAEDNRTDSLPVGRRTPDPERGRLALHSYACMACHTIPGVVGPEANVGPPLRGIAERRYIAGVLPNTFDNMVRWIRDPAAVDPRTAMPNLEVRQQDAVDIAAYLDTLH